MSLFCCPVCKQELIREEKAYHCPNGHSYDIASEGYVYLLSPNKKHSKMPGDTKQMVACRRDFLNTGLYEKFSTKLNELVLEAVQNLKAPVLVDAGCGEGYYTARLLEYLRKNKIEPQICGFDISKFAVKSAAKRYKDIEFAVGSIFDIPVLDASADCMINVFAPIVEGQFARVLKPGGTLILAVPGERHLFGLKEILYENPYENEYKETEYEGFRFIKRIAVPDEITIHDSKTMEDLFAMTPYYWKTPVEGCNRLKQTQSLHTEIEFDFLVYHRT